MCEGRGGERDGCGRERETGCAWVGLRGERREQRFTSMTLDDKPNKPGAPPVLSEGIASSLKALLQLGTVPVVS